MGANRPGGTGGARQQGRGPRVGQGCDGAGEKAARLQGEGGLAADAPPPSCPVASRPLEQRSLEDAPGRAAIPAPGIWGSSEPGRCSQRSSSAPPKPGSPPTARAPSGCFTGGLGQLDQAGPQRAEPGPQSPAAQRLAEAALPEDSLAGNTRGQSCPGPLPVVWLWTDHIPSQSLGVPSGHWGDGRRPLQPRAPLPRPGPAAGFQPLCPSQDAGLACPWRTRQQESGQSGAPVPAQHRGARPLHAEPQFPHLQPGLSACLLPGGTALSAAGGRRLVGPIARDALPGTRPSPRPPTQNPEWEDSLISGPEEVKS